MISTGAASHTCAKAANDGDLAGDSEHRAVVIWQAIAVESAATSRLRRASPRHPRLRHEHTADNATYRTAITPGASEAPVPDHPRARRKWRPHALQPENGRRLVMALDNQRTVAEVRAPLRIGTTPPTNKGASGQPAANDPKPVIGFYIFAPLAEATRTGG